MQAKRRGDLPTQDARRPRSGSSTCAERWTATPATSSTLGVRARRMSEQRQATTPDGVVVTTAMRTVLRRQSPRGPVCSAGRSARRPSPSASASPRPSSSTMGRRTPRVAQRLPPGGATSDEVIIRNLPLHLGDSARMWLEHLPAS
jgi:hypothetical protein